MTDTRKRLVIYTVLTGAKEPLGNPLAELPGINETDLELAFVCFTDNRSLKSELWEFRYLDDIPLPPEKLSRRPKALPHEYLPDWEFSLYIDNIVTFKRLPQAADLDTQSAYLFKVFRHATRSNPQQEAEAIMLLGYEKGDRLSAQLDFYAQHMALDSISPLSTCTVILRQHKHPALRAFGVTWWEQILHFCKRDQMSFDFAAKWTRCQLEHLPGLKNDNELIHNNANIQPNRVHANFDPVKYAWLHRDHPQAVADPRQHYLDFGRHEGRDFGVTPDLLEYLCHRYGSSLGGQVAPRRGLATALQALLQNRRVALQKPAGRMLLVRVNDNGPTAFSPHEFERAELVLCSYLPNYAGTRVELSSAQLALGQLGLRAVDGYFDLLLVLGMPGALLGATYKMLRAALRPAGGCMCVLAIQACTVRDIAEVEGQIHRSLAPTCTVTTSIDSSHHDSLTQPLGNSLLGFEWSQV